MPSAYFVFTRVGVDHKSVMRLRGSGDEGRNGGKSGDVYVSFVVKPRPDLKRRGLDLVSKVKPLIVLVPSAESCLFA